MTILVTGGASGLGAAITEELASNNINLVYFTYFRSEKQAKELEKKHSNVRAVFCDFTNEQSIDKLLSQMETFEIQVLINNALPAIHIQHFHKTGAAVFLDSFRVNVMPLIKISQKAVELFRKKKFGKIITVLSSAVINKPPVGWSNYVAEKNYILSVCKSMAVENAAFNITSNCVSPGFMLTDLNKEMDERVVEDMKAKHPLKQLLTTTETTQAIVFLAGASQQINGTNIVINAASDLA